MGRLPLPTTPSATPHAPETSDEVLLRKRLKKRRGHFAGAALLASQLATLEKPAPDEGIASFAIDASPEAIVGAMREHLGL